jgi:hypothetical protein
MDDVGVLLGHLEYFTSILYILWPFGIFCDNLAYFSRFGMLQQEKSGIPVLKSKKMFWEDVSETKGIFF